MAQNNVCYEEHFAASGVAFKWLHDNMRTNICIRHLFNNNKLDLYADLKQLKLALDTEQNICISTNNENRLQKIHFIYDNI